MSNNDGSYITLNYSKQCKEESFGNDSLMMCNGFDEDTLDIDLESQNKVFKECTKKWWSNNLY